MNYIINPTNNKKINLFSVEGKKLLKNYIKNYQGGIGNYFMKKIDFNLNEKQKKYCRCLLHVTDNNPKWCNKTKAWKKTRYGKRCYNPYAVCADKIKTTTGRLPCYYNFKNKSIPDNEIISYAQLNHKEINKWSRLNNETTIRQLLDNNDIPNLRKLLNKWYKDKKL